MDDGPAWQRTLLVPTVAHHDLAEDGHVDLVGIDELGAVDTDRAAVLQGADYDRPGRSGGQAHAEPLSLAPVGEPVLMVDMAAQVHGLIDRACRHVHSDSVVTSLSS